MIKRAADIRSSEITDKRQYLNRCAFIQAATGTVAAAAASLVGSGELHAATLAPHGRKLGNVKKSAFSTAEKVNTWEQITRYNNFYEFGTSYDSASTFARSLKPEPWTITVDGECNRRGSMNLEDVLKGKTLEEREIVRRRTRPAMPDRMVFGTDASHEDATPARTHRRIPHGESRVSLPARRGPDRNLQES